MATLSSHVEHPGKLEGEARFIPLIKARVRSLSIVQAVQLADEVLSMSAPQQIKS